MRENRGFTCQVSSDRRGLGRLAEGAGVHDGAKNVALPHDGAAAAGRGRLF
ncbi:TPA: hypothetical protein MAA82_000630 [Klebsiella pneumoniae]|nr:hypothetical protein [Klebsiella pneumoniae]HBQ5708379.1 hypothetical protein [Klebsiella pneumoniae subsp. pneumoniae]MBP0694435.1 hypothetical protein [Klebsiella pneumoniae]MBV2016597.1 hypothetical protein [Klebsiella pneumoniae]MCE5402346.1 hypothetical protein [Klebsiella pneumoniae]